MMERRLQEIEKYLDDLVASLKRGELPVNLQRVSQVFDAAIVELPPSLDVPVGKFIELYNDLPNILTAYAFDTNLTANSYKDASQGIIFERFSRGNYWILPIGLPADGNAWLVLNKFQILSLDRLGSLKYSFDIVGDTDGNDDRVYHLQKPAVVKRLPTPSASWKLVERGLLSTHPKPAIPFDSDSIIAEVKKQIEADIQSKIDESSAKNSGIDSNTIELIINKNFLKVFWPKIEGKIKDSIDAQLKDIQSQLNTVRDNNSLSSTTIERLIELKIKQFQQDSTTIDRSPTSNFPEVIDGVFVVPPSVDNQRNDLGKMWKESRQEDSQTNEPVISPDRGNLPDVSPFTRLYNMGEKVFLSSYNTIAVDLDPSNNQPTIVVESRNGMYFLVRFEDSLFYLVPRHDLPIDDTIVATLQHLFEFGELSHRWSLINAATASPLPSSGNRKWQIEQRGILRFEV
jgi:hypothetical protein